MSPYDPQIHHRRSTRLKGYDYSQNGAYFITVCTHGKQCLFGQIADGNMELNDLGRIVLAEWLAAPKIRESVELDEFVVMPNHFHAAFLILSGWADQPTPVARAEEGVCQYAPTPTVGFHSPSLTAGAIVRGFKSAVTSQINAKRDTLGQPVWQRGLYEHIIRNEHDLSQIRQYIANNPAKWQLDRENPDRIKR